MNLESGTAKIQQIIWNLLNNAVKFTPDGGCIEIYLREVGDWVEVRVNDTGQGIAPEFLPLIFDRFRQADSSMSRTNDGLGLGLAIVRQLVEIQGGSIEAYSDGVDRGSTFIARFPLLAPVAADIPVESAFEEPPRAEALTIATRIQTDLW
ncbi:MAG: ATP-binding protein, partial [Proteobacteria bacterium]